MDLLFTHRGYTRKVIDQTKVRMCYYCEKCGSAQTKVYLHPAFFDTNNVPNCQCGKRLTYSHTEIEE